jgi:hypothetical protein
LHKDNLIPNSIPHSEFRTRSHSHPQSQSAGGALHFSVCVNVYLTLTKGCTHSCWSWDGDVLLSYMSCKSGLYLGRCLPAAVMCQRASFPGPAGAKQVESPPTVEILRSGLISPIHIHK